MAVTIAEIDSFTSKFKALLANGLEATLKIEAVKGEVFVTLKAGLERKVWTPPSVTSEHMKKPRSPSYYLRQEKRKLERQQGMKAEKGTADVVGATDTLLLVETGSEEAPGVQESNEYKMSMNDKKNGSETLIFSHWSETEVSSTDAVKQIERRILRSFTENDIAKEDQKYEICSAECTDTDNNEIEAKVKFLRNFSKLKQAVRMIETRYSTGDAYEVSFRGISSST